VSFAQARQGTNSPNERNLGKINIGDQEYSAKLTGVGDKGIIIPGQTKIVINGQEIPLEHDAGNDVNGYTFKYGNDVFLVGADNNKGSWHIGKIDSASGEDLFKSVSGKEKFAEGTTVKQSSAETHDVQAQNKYDQFLQMQEQFYPNSNLINVTPVKIENKEPEATQRSAAPDIPGDEAAVPAQSLPTQPDAETEVGVKNETITVASTGVELSEDETAETIAPNQELATAAEIPIELVVEAKETAIYESAIEASVQEQEASPAKEAVIETLADEEPLADINIETQEIMPMTEPAPQVATTKLETAIIAESPENRISQPNRNIDDLIDALPPDMNIDDRIDGMYGGKFSVAWKAFANNHPEMEFVTAGGRINFHDAEFKQSPEFIKTNLPDSLAGKVDEYFANTNNPQPPQVTIEDIIRHIQNRQSLPSAHQANSTTSYMDSNQVFEAIHTARIARDQQLTSTEEQALTDFQTIINAQVRISNLANTNYEIKIEKSRADGQSYIYIKGLKGSSRDYAIRIERDINGQSYLVCNTDADGSVFHNLINNALIRNGTQLQGYPTFSRVGARGGYDMRINITDARGGISPDRQNWVAVAPQRQAIAEATRIAADAANERNAVVYQANYVQVTSTLQGSPSKGERNLMRVMGRDPERGENGTVRLRIMPSQRAQVPAIETRLKSNPDLTFATREEGGFTYITVSSKIVEQSADRLIQDARNGEVNELAISREREPAPGLDRTKYQNYGFALSTISLSSEGSGRITDGITLRIITIENQQFTDPETGEKYKLVKNGDNYSVEKMA
jgi:hypothetical protein